MNRRQSLGVLFGKHRTKESSVSEQNTFTPYSGEWSFQQAAHLLRRTTFGPTPAQIKAAVKDGLEKTIQTIFEEQPIPDPPIYYNFENDPEVALGESWVDAIEDNDIDKLRAARRQSLLTWAIKNMYESEAKPSIYEKMQLFWHNHFVVSNPTISRRDYAYYTTLRKHALGNFKTLVEEITVDSAMLRYLNGHQNSRFAPNENYSRELLELFTIGKGPTVGPGDYTNYTEQDVSELARALTGWRSNSVAIDDPVGVFFNDNRHDTGEKQLSHRFDNVVIRDAGEEEYKKVIDIIFQKAEVARFISRKLYNWFLHSEITSDIEATIIEPMAQMIIADAYEIKNALIAFLSSEHFYTSGFKGCMITHPADFYFKLLNTFQVALPEDEIERYYVLRRIYNNMGKMDMALFYHPTVAGWKAFYQAPQYTKIWISSVTLPLRQTDSDRLVNGFTIRGFRVQIDVLNFVAQLEQALEPDELIKELAAILFVHPITEAQLVALKAILLPGLPDYEWTIEYSDFLSGDVSLKESIEGKLQALIKTMLRMPEFYLI